MGELAATLGPFFTARVSPDGQWARSILYGEQSGAVPMEY